MSLYFVLFIFHRNCIAILIIVYFNIHGVNRCIFLCSCVSSLSFFNFSFRSFHDRFDCSLAGVHGWGLSVEYHDCWIFFNSEFRIQIFMVFTVNSTHFCDTFQRSCDFLVGWGESSAVLTWLMRINSFVKNWSMLWNNWKKLKLTPSCIKLNHPNVFTWCYKSIEIDCRKFNDITWVVPGFFGWCNSNKAKNGWKIVLRLLRSLKKYVELENLPEAFKFIIATICLKKLFELLAV